MAMTNRSVSQQASVKRRIRHFYSLLNQGDFRRCYELIDPQVRVQPRSITFFQYETASRQFVEHFGPVTIVDISVVLHVNEPSELYKGRDFVVGKTTWNDEAGERHVF